MRVTVNLQIKKTKERSDSKCPVYARCTMDGKRFELSTGVFVSKTEWDENAQVLLGRSEKVRIINNRLEKFVSKIFDSYNQLEAKGEEFDISHLKDKLTGIKPKNGLLDFFNKIIFAYPLSCQI